MRTDEEIMLEVKKGDIGQVEELYKRYSKKLYNYFVTMMRDTDLSADLMQNVFERMIQYRSTYNVKFPFRAWMYRIALNVRNDEYRRGKNQRRVEQHSVQNQVMQSVLPAIESRETVDQARQALKQISPDYRDVILLAWYQKMKYAEIAEVLGTTEGSVKVKMHRAVKQLRREFEKVVKE